MTTHPTLFDAATLPHNGTASSRDGARVASRTAGKKRRAMEAFVRSCGEHGATDAEIAAHLSDVFGRVVHPGSVTGIRTSAVSDGVFALASFKRRAPSGVMVCVWQYRVPQNESEAK